MSTQRKNRKAVQNSKTDPKNYTCGRCKRVVPFKKVKNDAGFWDHVCSYCDPEE